MTLLCRTTFFQTNQITHWSCTTYLQSLHSQLSLVYLNMFLAVHSSLEHLAAVRAHEGSMFTVYRQMSRQTSFRCEGQTTELAAEGFQASVRPQVSLENTLRYERLGALQTFVRFFSRVRAHVLFEVTRLLEGATAVLTTIRSIKTQVKRIRLKLVFWLRLHQT